MKPSNKMKSTSLSCKALLLLLALAALSQAVQLENWRMPYYVWAARMGLAKGSESGMFWDNIDRAPVFGASLWPDSVRYAQNHWSLEPSLTTGAVTPALEGRDQGYWHFDLLNDIRFHNLLIRQTLDADVRYDYDGELYPAHQQRFAKGRFEEAYAQVDFAHWFARLGRIKRNWGPFADRSLIVSTNPYSYDALEWGVHSSMFEFRHLFAAFPQRRSEFDTDGRVVNRYFSAHALNIMFGKWLTLGILESAVFPRANGVPDLAYVNPISSYTVINTNQEGDANIMLGFQGTVRPFTDRVTLAGQVVLDDIQVDDSLVTDKEPNHWGLDIGVFWRDPLQLTLRNLVRIEYTRYSPWLYTVPDGNAAQGERYTLLGRSLGYGDIDGDWARMGYTITGQDYWGADLTVGYRRQGNKKVTDLWGDSNSPTSPPGVPPEFMTFSFPTGTVERTYEVSISALGYFSNYTDIRVGVDNCWISNRDNKVTDKLEYAPRFFVDASAHFCNFFFMLAD